MPGFHKLLLAAAALLFAVTFHAPAMTQETESDYWFETDNLKYVCSSNE